MSAKHMVDRGVAIVAAAAAPVDALLIHLHVFSSETGGLVGAIVTALVAGYHGGAVAQKRGTGASTEVTQ